MLQSPTAHVEQRFNARTEQKRLDTDGESEAEHTVLI